MEHKKHQKSKVYTGMGDSGTTSLFGGEKTEKSSEVIRALGEIDELNSTIGLVKAELKKTEWNVSGSRSVPHRRHEACVSHDTPEDVRATDVIGVLHGVQETLFSLGADLMVLCRKDNRFARDFPVVTRHTIASLEKEIDFRDSRLPHLESFCIPGENGVSALFHFARTVCRRAERQVVAALKECAPKRAVSGDVASQKAVGAPLPIVYLNRLSDLLFVLAREYAERRSGTPGER